MTKKSTTEDTNTKKPKRKKPKNYINNHDLLIEWKASHEQDQMTDKFSKMMMLLTKRYSSKVRFNVCDTFREDMEAFAIMTVAKVWKSFNPEKSNNPFAYFTQVVKRAFYQFQNMERKQRDIGNEMLIEHGQPPSHAYMVEYEYRNFNPEDAMGVDADTTVKDIDVEEYNRGN